MDFPLALKSSRLPGKPVGSSSYAHLMRSRVTDGDSLGEAKEQKRLELDLLSPTENSFLLLKRSVYSICLSIHLSVNAYMCQSIFLYMYSSVHPFISTHTFIPPTVNQSLHPSIHSSSYLPIHSSTHSFIYPAFQSSFSVKPCFHPCTISTHLLIHLFIHASSTSIHSPIHTFTIHLHTHLLSPPSIHLFTHLTTHTAFYLSLHSLIHPSIYLPIYPHTTHPLTYLFIHTPIIFIHPIH